MKVDANLNPHPRYRLLERIGKGGMGEVFRAHDRLLDQAVALKRVCAPRVVNASAQVRPDREIEALRLHLTQEFRTLASLRHPHIVSVLDYGFDDDQQPYFTMELLEGAIPLDQAARDQPFSVQVGLLLQILQALTYLHRRGVLHLDLKPGNILVLRGLDGLHVKLLDFGLALLAGSLGAEQVQVLGTGGYVSPEVLVGTAPSEASDLFAVGVIAHELLVGMQSIGEYPITDLILEVLGRSPVFSGHEKLSSPLSAVLRRALCRDPSERYIDAAVFAHELARAAELPVQLETTEIRESFLQAATFVAREAELSTLRKALDAAVEKAGSVWLIGGESGVGKSRLLDELRTLALVRGTKVVRGQAISAGGAPYQVWQGILRSLCLDAVIDNLEAGVLRAVVPDIATLLERPIAEPPPLDPQNAQTRFLFTVEKLLLSQREPLVLLLEDLHWAEPASLALLKRLLSDVARHSLLIIGSYRQDERPTLRDELPGAQLLSLNRFSGNELSLLSSSMLGEVGRRTEVVTLLERETEGNAFFAVEVLRALAEEAGGLDQIDPHALPTHLMIGGIMRLLTRRLAQIPTGTEAVLHAAAALDRQLDLRVLETLFPTLDLQSWLIACTNAGVLEPYAGAWRFAHDKLRECTLKTLSLEVRTKVHRRVADALAATYLDDDNRAALLSHHYALGDAPEQTWHHAMRAGTHASRGISNAAVSGLHDAVRYYELALTALAQLPPSRVRVRREIDAVVALAEVVGNLVGLGSFLPRLEACETLISGLDSDDREDRHRAALVAYYLGLTHHQCGQPAAAERYLVQAITAAIALNDAQLIGRFAVSHALVAFGAVSTGLRLTGLLLDPLERLGNLASWVDLMTAHAHMLASVGDYAGGCAALRRLAERLPEVNDVNIAWAVRLRMTFIYSAGGDWPAMLAHVQPLCSDSDKLAPPLRAGPLALSALALVRLGRIAEAQSNRDLADQQIALHGALPSLANTVHFIDVKIAMAEGRYAEALAMIEPLARTLRAQGKAAAAWAERLWALALVHVDPTRGREADELFAKAVALTESRGDVLEVAHCQVAWARGRLALGDQEGARTHATCALDHFVAAGCTYAANEVRRTLLFSDRLSIGM